MKIPRVHLTRRQRTEFKRDLAVFIGAFLSTGVLDDGQVTRPALVAAALVAVKVTARKLFPHEDIPA